MVTILLERREFIRATHFTLVSFAAARAEVTTLKTAAKETNFTSADLFLGCPLAMAVGSKSRRQFTSVDSSIVKGPIRLRDSAAKIWPPT